MPVLLRSKPVEVTGVRWTGDNLAEMKEFVGSKLQVARCRCKNQDKDPYENWKKHGPWLTVETKEGDMDVGFNWVVIRREKDVFTVIHPDAYYDHYEKLADLDDDGKPVNVTGNAGRGEETHVAEADERAMESFTDQATPPDIITYLWNMASEEASETGQAAAKCVRFGHESIDPRTDIAAKTRYVDEMNDQLGVLRILNEELAERGEELISGVGDEALIMASVRKRKDNLYTEYQQGRFTLPDVKEG